MDAIVTFFAAFQAQSIWFVVGLVLLSLASLIPTPEVIFFGASALIVGLALMAGIDLGVAWQITSFGVLAIFLIVVLRRHLKSWFVGESRNGGDTVFSPNDIAVVCKNFSNGYGEVKLRGAIWQAHANENLKKGDQVSVVSNIGIILNVRLIR